MSLRAADERSVEPPPDAAATVAAASAAALLARGPAVPESREAREGGSGPGLER